YESGRSQLRRIEFVIGGYVLQGYNELPTYTYDPLAKSGHASSQPAWCWYTIVIGEGDDLATGSTPTSIACCGRTMGPCYGNVAKGGGRIGGIMAGASRTGVINHAPTFRLLHLKCSGRACPCQVLYSCQILYHQSGLITSSVIDDNDLIVCCIKVLGQQRS